MKLKEVFNRLREAWNESSDTKIIMIYDLFGRSRPHERDAAAVKIEARMRAVIAKLQQKWQECSRTVNVFLQRHAEWLDGDVDFFKGEETQPTSSEGSFQQKRSLIPYDEASQRTKLRRTAALRATATTQELVATAASRMYSEGNRIGAKLMRDIFAAEPNKITEVKAAIDAVKDGHSGVIPLTPEQAVSYMAQNDLSKEQYLGNRKMLKEQNAASLLPSYHVVAHAKNECYPRPEFMTVTESIANISLQGLMDHTTSRLCQVEETVLKILTPRQLSSLVLISKWGLDGSGGHSRYKQQSTDKNLNDSHLLATSTVPLQLFTRNDDGKKVIVWQNPRPSSPRYCRPLKLQFEKETTTLIVDEVKRVEEEIKCLVPSEVNVAGCQVKVKHDLRLTMVDGKVCNAITCNKNSQACYICGATAKEMNDLTKVSSKTVNPKTLQLGLSTLHAWIRTFEYLLHVSYRLDIGKWQCRTEADKKKMAEKKTKVQEGLKEHLGLIVDVPKQGFGSSNDGNTARRFFESPTVTATITGLDKSLIERFQIILNSLASAFEINVTKYEKFALETAKKCVELYPWYNMPPTVHKILLHGASIMQNAPLPIGMFAEDALESRHKDCKKIRLSHTRKTSREDCNLDLLHMCLVTSDPLITSLRKLPPKRRGQLSKGVLSLLTEPNLSITHLEEYEDSTDDEYEV